MESAVIRKAGLKIKSDVPLLGFPWVIEIGKKDNLWTETIREL